MLEVYRCPDCQRRIETNQEIGQVIPCPHCGEAFALHPSNAVARHSIGRIIVRLLILFGYVLFVAVPLVLTIRFFVNRTEKQEPIVAQAPPAPTGESHAKFKPPDPDSPSARRPRKDRDQRKTGEDGEPAIGASESGAAIAPPPHEAHPIALAPAPHEFVWKVPIREYTSKWQTVGAVRVRLAGLGITKVPIRDANGEKSESAAEYLVLAVEVQMNAAVKPRTLEPWTPGQHSYAAISLTGGKALHPAPLPPGAKWNTGLPPQQPIPTEPMSVRDFLIFAVPPEGPGELSLRLDAERCGESGDIWIKIPAEAWKK